MTTQPLIINNFDQAIADSPHKGFGLMSRVDIESFPGAVKVGKDLTSLFHTALSKTFTAVAATDVCTISSGELPITGTAVVLTTTNTLPAGLAVATIYFIIKLSDTTFKLATTIANANVPTPINITDTGTGVHTVTTINPGTINHIIKDPRVGRRFYLDSNGRVWYGGDILLLLYNSAIDTGGASVTNANGTGISIASFSHTTSNFLFVFRNALIDVIDVYATSDVETPSWTNGWQSLNSGAGSTNSHHSILAQDNLLYFCDDKYVGSIKEKTGQTFDPASGATYTYNYQALDLPTYEVAQHFEELGINLLTAGNTFNKVYPWDRISDSFNLPLDVPEIGVKKLKNIGGLVYILAGTIGNIYITQGSYVRHFKKIPTQLTNNLNTAAGFTITWGGIGAINGSLLFGMGVDTSGNSGAYLLYPDGRLVIDQLPSTGSTNVTAFECTTNFYYMGYSGGADKHDTDRYSSFEGVVQSSLYRVATKTEKATYSTLEVVLAKPTAPAGVRIGYRKNTSGSFTPLDTFTADGTETLYKNDGIGLIDIEDIQIQAELDDDIELVEIRLLP